MFLTILVHKLFGIVDFGLQSLVHLEIGCAAEKRKISFAGLFPFGSTGFDVADLKLIVGSGQVNEQATNQD